MVKYAANQALRRASIQLSSTVIDLSAGLFFVAGSYLFFFEAWVFWGTCLFLIGSLCFVLRPALSLRQDWQNWRKESRKPNINLADE